MVEASVNRTASRPRRIAFVHPDLGIGGAERLLVDAALQLQDMGHEVVVFTSHHDRQRCFEETANGTLAVRVHGNFLPVDIAGRLRAPCMIARMAVLAVMVALSRGRFDVIFCDLVPQVLPLLRRLTAARIIYYCHFPDQLLTPRRHGWYHVYRWPLDWAEARATAAADRVLVNSRFTESVFRATFPQLATKRVDLAYPGVDPRGYLTLPEVSATAPVTVLSLNRFDSRKNLALAIDALIALRRVLPAASFARVRLCMAGGYDARLLDNRATLAELQARAAAAGLGAQVVFRTSISDAERYEMLEQSRCVVYTPEDEHFGIVPLEAMAAGRPVVAVNQGGPTETIVDGETGFLRSPTPEAFAEALARLVLAPDLAREMGRAARRRVAERFTVDTFGHRLAEVVDELTGEPKVSDV